MTALVILSTNVDITDTENAASLVARAFATGSSFGNLIVSIGLSLFAFSTILGWAYYGETALGYLFGEKIIIPYRIIYVIFVFLGANMDLGLVWIIANILNGFMALPNLFAIINLAPIVVKLSKDFFKDPEKIRKSPDEYNFLLKNN